MPPAFALSQDQTLRFISPRCPKASQAVPANYIQIPSIPSPPSHPNRNHQNQTPPRQHPPQPDLRPATAAPPAHPTPHPRINGNRSPQDTHPAKARSQPSQKDNQTQTHSTKRALPKPDVVFNEQPLGQGQVQTASHQLFLPPPV